jgi:Spy/CpxP family protein refolding chaperone
MKLLNRMLITVFTVALLQSSLATAADGMGQREGHGGTPGERLLRMADKLELTSDQRNSLEAILADAKGDIEALRNRQEASRERFQKVSPDASNYNSITTETANEAAELARERVLLASNLRAQTYAILTDSQREQLEKLKAEKGAGGSRGNQHSGGKPRK